MGSRRGAGPTKRHIEVIDPSVVDNDGVYRKIGPARVFTREREAIAAIKSQGTERVKPGDIVALRQSSQKAPAILHALEEVKGRGVPEWLQFDAAALSGKIGSVPTREQINLPVQEQLIVELYSK